jgi:hypothetical protein
LTWVYSQFMVTAPGELKVQENCCQSVRPSVRKLLHFRLLQNRRANFNQIKHKSSFGGVDSNYLNEGEGPCQRKDNSKNVKIHWQFLKIFSSRTVSRSISIKLSINCLYVKGILNLSSKGPDPLQTGDNHKNGMGSFSRIIKPE